jgi:integrase
MKANMFDSVFYEEWLREKGTLAESTIFVYVKSIESFLKTGPDLNNIDDYNKFLINKTIKKRATHLYSVIKSFITFKIEGSALQETLIKGLVKPKFQQNILRERRHLSDEQIFDVINNLERKKHRIIALIQSLTGAREGDVMRLKQGGILFEEYEKRNTMRLNLLGKRSKRNVVFIHDDVAQQFIMDFITNNKTAVDNYYFLELGTMNNRKGDPNNEAALMRMNYHWYWLDLKQALQLSNVRKEEFATHDFRRCFARKVWERYKDINILQHLLHHTDPKVTLRYLQQTGLDNIDYLKEIQVG